VVATTAPSKIQDRQANPGRRGPDARANPAIVNSIRPIASIAMLTKSRSTDHEAINLVLAPSELEEQIMLYYRLAMQEGIPNSAWLDSSHSGRLLLSGKRIL
jgi:hypothetical protein